MSKRIYMPPWGANGRARLRGRMRSRSTGLGHRYWGAGTGMPLAAAGGRVCWVTRLPSAKDVARGLMGVGDGEERAWKGRR